MGDAVRSAPGIDDHSRSPVDVDSVLLEQSQMRAITGAGDVTYFGNPKTVEKHVTGAGSIRHKE